MDVAGDTATDPGPKPQSYALTPERLATIAKRGAVTRADDNVSVIEVLKRLDTEHRHATADEQHTLASYVGWGDSAVNQYLAEQPKKKWSARQRHIHERLQAVTTPAERNDMKASRVNAHFTFGLYTPIWDALTRYGFTGGRVLEPAVGTGHAWGLMPAETRESSTLSGIELEPLTAKIAASLYPTARVRAIGYQDSDVPRHSQDLVISNVPFGNFPVFDKALPEASKWSIHNYYFAKALEHVRPGGIVSFVTTHMSMDAATSQPFREYVSARADFLGAVRLPITAFSGTAKTEVITDVVFLRARKKGEPVSPLNDQWNVSDPVTLPGPKGERTFNRSRYYAEHPDMVLGDEKASGTMRGIGGNYNVEGTFDPERMLARLHDMLPEGAYTMESGAAAGDPDVSVDDEAFYQVKPFSFTEKDGTLYRANKAGIQEPYRPTKKQGDGRVIDKAKIARVKAHIPVRDALRTLMDGMADGSTSDVEIKKWQQALRKAYNTFHKEYGRLYDPTNKRMFSSDPQSANILALEQTKQEAKYSTDKNGKRSLKKQSVFVSLSDIFTKRTIQAVAEVTSVETPQDALWASLSSRARIDWKWMADVYGGTDEATVQAALLKSGDVFRNAGGGLGDTRGIPERRRGDKTRTGQGRCQGDLRRPVRRQRGSS